MKRHFVHVYHTFRSKFAVDAVDHADAIAKATSMFSALGDRLSIVGMVTPNMGLEMHAAVGEGYLLSGDAEDIIDFLVDEADDEGHERSAHYDSEGNPRVPNGTQIALSDQERDQVLAALRLWQEQGNTIPAGIRDIAVNDGKNTLMTDVELDALCDRFNR